MNKRNIKLNNYFLALPNTFEKSTTFHYTLPQPAPVRLFITDVMGKEVAEVINSSNEDAGEYRVDYNGNELPPVIYFYTLQAGDHMETKKLVKLR